MMHSLIVLGLVRKSNHIFLILFYAGVPGEFADVECGLGLEIVVNLPIVLACAVVVEVNILVNVLDAVAGHFEHGKDKGFIVGGLHPASVSVLHVFFLDFKEETHGEGAHVSKLLADEAVEFILDFSKGIGARVALFEVVIVQLAVEVVGVGHAGLLRLIDHVQHLEDQLAQQFVVSAYQYSDRLLAAVLLDSVIDVGHSRHTLRVTDKYVSAAWQFGFFEEEGDEVGSPVIGGVVDDDQFIVLVLLVEDGLQVVLVAVVFGVVVGGNDHADGQLRWIKVEVVLVVKSFHLLLDLFLHVAAFEGIDKGRAQIHAAQCPGVADLLFFELVLLANVVENRDLPLPHLLL